MEKLSYEAIERAFRALDDELTRREISCDVVVVGGAALVLRHRAREATKDVDAVVLPESIKSDVLSAAATVAGAASLPADWLNDGAKGFLHGLDETTPVWTGTSLRVRAASDAQLLAMKLCAWRDDLDIEDARLLLSKLVGSREDVLAAVRPYFVPGRELRAQYAFDDLWESDREAQ